MLRSRSNSSYSLQDLSTRPPSHRPSQTSDANSSDTRPRNSNTSARGDVSAAPQEQEEVKKKSRLGRFWLDQREDVSGLSPYISRDVNGRNVGSAAVLAAARGFTSGIWILRHGEAFSDDLLLLLDWDDTSRCCAHLETSTDHDEWEGVGWRV
ncbi:uncharacterized protein FTJAE_3468 [Fusarium tjaetaba]|uniref:Uncharacterized protein n=1 Tax=Fusarium tjaetaba TaxID=1567544 RepID=A0A8H5VYY8_9HYPO|nr:uncharacterized protein FTJAE_3468 [Fusarium tjaetaba]KAF5642752.1 hypothetical protein FTJAE_3468 [Fusarium tjaetaba]